ncbi:MAG TPA: ureidoglycolate lyase [Methylomirabilota bacterium]
MTSPTITHLSVEPLTEESFRPFGQVIGESVAAPDFRGEQGTLGWSIDWRGGRAKISYLRTPYQGLRFRKLERHLDLTQAFIPMGGAPAVVAVAAPTDLRDRDAVPGPDAVRAFLLDGSVGYALHKGTWHSLDRFAVTPPDTRWVIITDHETADDLEAAYLGRGGFALSQEVDYAARSGTTFEIVL